MRFIAILLLTVTCAGLSWAVESFTADELRGIETQMAGVQTGASKVYTITRGDTTYNLELTANADGTYAVGGAGVPSGLLGSLKFDGGAAYFKGPGQRSFSIMAFKSRNYQIVDGIVRIDLPLVVQYMVLTNNSLETHQIFAGPYDS